MIAPPKLAGDLLEVPTLILDLEVDDVERTKDSSLSAIRVSCLFV
jgi:hypothetical protein